MSYAEEILYRKEIMDKVRNGIRTTSEDKLWLATHSLYNHSLGFPYVNMDVIHLFSDDVYIVRIKVEECVYQGRILPIVTVPAGKGKIITNNIVSDYRGKEKKNKPVKMLGALVNLGHREMIISYQSDMEVLGVSFECEYFDDKQRIMIRKSSDTGDDNYAMMKEILGENKVLYRCKAPTDSDFNSLVFSLEWWKEN